MKIGDIFECADGIMPKEALDLCVDGVSIQEVEPNVEGVRQFQIVAPIEPTIEERQAQIQVQLTNAVQHVLDAKAQRHRFFHRFQHRLCLAVQIAQVFQCAQHAIHIDICHCFCIYHIAILQWI